AALQQASLTARFNPTLDEAIQAAQEAITAVVAYNERNRVIAGGHLESFLLSLLVPVVADGLEALGVGVDLALAISKGAVSVLKGDVVSLLLDAAWPTADTATTRSSGAGGAQVPFSESSVRDALGFLLGQLVAGRAVLNPRRPVRNVRRV